MGQRVTKLRKETESSTELAPLTPHGKRKCQEYVNTAPNNSSFIELFTVDVYRTVVSFLEATGFRALDLASWGRILDIGTDLVRGEQRRYCFLLFNNEV